MSDPMAMLDIERRTGIKNSDVDDFVKKTTAVQDAIASLVKGDVDPSKISLKKYGILTEMEQKEEDERRETNRREMEARVAKEKEIERVREREKWWDGATYMYGPREGSEEWLEERDGARKEEKEAREKRTEEENRRLKDRYSLDYNRWNVSRYVPDDEATKEEAAILQKKKEDEDMAKFEADNAAWCEGQKEDINKRKKDRVKKEKNAEVERQRGNKCYKQKNYKRALEAYMSSLSGSAYKTTTLTNISLCHTKTKNWEEAMEVRCQLVAK